MNIDNIKNLPKEFYFRSNINPLGILYLAKELKDEYEVIDCDGGCKWNLTKKEIHECLLNGKYYMVEG